MNNIRSQIFDGKREERRALIGSKRPRGAKADTLASIPVTRSEVRTSDTRDEDRHRLVDEQLRLTHDGSQYDVDLINLSGGGAMVSGDFVPNLWDRVDLHFAPDAALECVVRWVKEDRIGLEFAHETKIDCPPEQRVAVLREVIARSFPDVELELSVNAPEAAPEPAPSAPEHRKDRRHPLIWSGVLHHDYQSTPVRLRNISERGAMIECSVPLPVGAEPLLDLGDSGSLFGTVTWRVGDQAGLAFKEPFDVSRLARSRPEIAPMWANGAARARDASGAGSPWAREWDRMSLSDLREELEGWLKR